MLARVGVSVTEVRLRRSESSGYTDVIWAVFMNYFIILYFFLEDFHRAIIISRIDSWYLLDS